MLAIVLPCPGSPLLKARFGVNSMPETAENVAQQFNVGRADQDAFALRSQQRTAEAIAAARLAEEIVEVTIQARKGRCRRLSTGRASASDEA